MMDALLEIILSFTCSVGFGIVFKIKPKELPLAGLAGVIVRIVLIIAKLFTSRRLLYTFLGALSGTFFAEFLGLRRNTSIAKFMYPAMVPMIPGDLLYNVIVCMINLDGINLLKYGTDLVASLVGIALGCMIAPMIVHSRFISRRGTLKQ